MEFKVYFKSDTFSPPTLDILLQCLFLEVLCCARWIPPQTEKTRVPGIRVCRVRCGVWLQLRRHSKANQLLKKHGHYVIVIDSNRVNHLKDCVPLTRSMVTPQVPPVQLTPLWRDFSVIFLAHVRAHVTLRRLKPSPGIDITWSHNILNCFIILEFRAGSQTIDVT